MSTLQPGLEGHQPQANKKLLKDLEIRGYQPNHAVPSSSNQPQKTPPKKP